MRILTVCLGNICRSPLAEGIIEHRFKAEGIPLNIDSCGTAAYHIGEKADPRSIHTAKNHGIDINRHRARKFESADFEKYDLILAMDMQNYEYLMARAQDESEAMKIKLIMDFVYPGQEIEVPDPYYGGSNGFESVYKMIDLAATELVNQVKKSTGDAANIGGHNISG